MVESVGIPLTPVYHLLTLITMFPVLFIYLCILFGVIGIAETSRTQVSTPGSCGCFNEFNGVGVC